MELNTNDGSTQGRCPQTVSATPVECDTERMRCLPEVAGRHYIALEHTVYDMLSMLSDDYEGGYWQYYRLSNGGFYMAPAQGPLRLVCVANGFDGVVSADTAGLIATAMAYSHLSFHPSGSCFAKAYELLSQFIGAHPDARAIRAALD